MSESRKVRFIEPVNRLKEKAIPNGPLAIDDAALEEVEQSLKQLTEDYIVIVGEDLINLRDAIDGLDEESAEQTENLKNVFLIAHKIKGMGGSFDYGLATLIAASICHFIEPLTDRANADAKKVMKLHLDGLNVVIASEMKGDGGGMGEDLLSGLASIVTKYHEARPT